MIHLLIIQACAARSEIQFCSVWLFYISVEITFYKVPFTVAQSIAGEEAVSLLSLEPWTLRVRYMFSKYLRAMCDVLECILMLRVIASNGNIYLAVILWSLFGSLPPNHTHKPKWTRLAKRGEWNSVRSWLWQCRALIEAGSVLRASMGSEGPVISCHRALA